MRRSSDVWYIHVGPGIGHGRLVTILTILLLIPVLQVQAGSGGARPMVLIYCQKEPRYGEELASILAADSRIDAEILALSDPELFRSMLYFPHVKVVVAVFNHDKNEGLGEHLEDFFRGGGGIVGMGFAGWHTTTLNSSGTVFSLNASYYVTGQYDREGKVFSHNLYIDQDHEINAGVGDFTAHTHKVIMRFNKSSGTRIPPSPPGQLTVLYREPVQNAPAIVVYEESGVCVTFGCFAGNTIERAPTYFGHFTEQEKFRELFTNAVCYVWENEHRFDETLSRANEMFDGQSSDLARVKKEAGKSERNRENLRFARSAVVAVLVLLSVAVIYRTCFMTHGGEGE